MTDIYASTLRQHWGYSDFRGIQRDIIESIGSGKDTLGLMPTGGGKSITFQVPALTMKGVCIVITPLIALMKDQVEALRRRGIKAAFIHSGLSHEQTLAVLENSVFGAYKFLYISPERLSSELFMTKLAHMEVSFITVDEAHCICQWGYDFRPAYLRIADIRRVKPHCPILALTATATPEVASDIQRCLLFREENVKRMSFYRPNLAYTVYHAEERLVGVQHWLDCVAGSCIIYMRNRQQCKELASHLSALGYSTTYYHAGLTHAEKNERQDAWHRGTYRIIVATNAFGMGIDKPDVRLVVHIGLPDSIEEYFQEAGRAGRDGEKSWSVIVMDGSELAVARRRVAQNYPPLDYIRDVYEKVCCFLSMAVDDGYMVTREFNMERFCQAFHFHPIQLTSALEALDRAGYIAFRDEEDGTSRLRIMATRGELFGVLDSTGERIFLSLFRHYGGIFVDYVYLDEDMVARETGLDINVIYTQLKELSKRKLISYIPRKHVPLITFRTRRVDKDEVQLPAAAYQRLKEAYEYRLTALMAYCTNASECRSRLLLKYFGETRTAGCGVCDVCQEDAWRVATTDEARRIRQAIIQRLSSGPVAISELTLPHTNEHALHQVIDQMRAHDELWLDEELHVGLKRAQQATS